MEIGKRDGIRCRFGGLLWVGRGRRGDIEGVFIRFRDTVIALDV